MQCFFNPSLTAAKRNSTLKCNKEILFYPDPFVDYNHNACTYLKELDKDVGIIEVNIVVQGVEQLFGLRKKDEISFSIVCFSIMSIAVYINLPMIKIKCDLKTFSFFEIFSIFHPASDFV